MRRGEQVWPEIVFKLKRLAIIIHWPKAMPMIHIDHKTNRDHYNYYTTMMTCRKILGPIYWVNEFYMEVIKKETDVTHPNFMNTPKGIAMRKADEEWENSQNGSSSS